VPSRIDPSLFVSDKIGICRQKARQIDFGWLDVGYPNAFEEAKMTDKKIKSQHDQTKTMPLIEAGRKYFGLGRSASYEAAERGEIPTIRIGGKIMALVPAIERMLEGSKKRKPARGLARRAN
jgi:ribosomal protein S14